MRSPAGRTYIWVRVFEFPAVFQSIHWLRRRGFYAFYLKSIAKILIAIDCSWSFAVRRAGAALPSSAAPSSPFNSGI